MAVGTTIPATPPFAPGALMWRRYGPLPVWGYAAILVGGLLIVMYLRRGKAADQAATAAAGQDASTIAANTPRSPIFILPQTGLQGPAGPAGPAGAPGTAGATDTVPPAPAGSGRDNPPGNPFLNPDGTLSVGAGANLYQAARSAGLSGGQFAALNPDKWKSNTRWDGKDASGNLIPYAIRDMPYRVK